MKLKLYIIPFLFLIISSCNSESESVNIFKLEDDIALGKQISAYIASDSSDMKLLDTAEFSSAYKHINSIKDKILNSGKLKYKNDFEWQVRIIKDDSTINAFATPGGYIYVYSGLIKYLDTEDQFAGIMAHEIAHADKRHSTSMLTKVYGISFLINMIIGNENETVRQITENLLSLKYSRGYEEDADKCSVIYLCNKQSSYKPDGAADFFEKMILDKRSGYLPEFLSSHPSPPNRINNIRTMANDLGCNKESNTSPDYEAFKNSLP